jgi:hypothetical protein
VGITIMVMVMVMADTQDLELIQTLKSVPSPMTLPQDQHVDTGHLLIPCLLLTMRLSSSQSKLQLL